MKDNDLKDLINKHYNEMLQMISTQEDKGKKSAVVDNNSPNIVDLTKTKKLPEPVIEFCEKNPKLGFAKIHAIDVKKNTPVQAEVSVIKKLDDYTTVFYNSVTNKEGIVDNLALPAPDKSLSQTPSTDTLPYAVYDVLVKCPTYETVPNFV